jgi:hypothetical protein
MATGLVLCIISSCDSATGHVTGGEYLVGAGDASSGGATWTALYDDFFGPNGEASCTAQETCHGDVNQNGAALSGFVCGASKEDCWSGMTFGVNQDAGGLPPIVEPGTTDFAKTLLHTSLHQGTSGDNTYCAMSAQAFACNMPCGNPPTCSAGGASYTFTTDDLARITTWVQQGALDN